MSPFTKPIRELTSNDIEGLLTSGAAEGPSLDFKRGWYQTSREYAKDVTAFANRQGGFLIIGAEETQGVLTALPGIDLSDAETLRTTLDQWNVQCIDPELMGTDIAIVPLSSGRVVVVVSVPQSYAAPHRVSAGGSNKFYIRRSASSDEATVEELRLLFNSDRDALLSARELVADRVSTFRKGQSPRNAIPTEGGIILHLVPIASLLGVQNWEGELAADVRNSLMLFGSTSGRSWSYTFDGYMIFDGDDPCRNYTLLFHNGIVEAACTRITYEESGHRVVNLSAIANRLPQAVHSFVESADRAGFRPPYYFCLSLVNVVNAVLTFGRPEFFSDHMVCDRNVLQCPEMRIDRIGDSSGYMKSLKGALDSLWHAAGAAYCTHYRDGHWISPILP